jgi:hypothetical protein
MKLTFAVSLLVLLFAGPLFAQSADSSATAVVAPSRADAVCVLAGSPPASAQFTVVKQLKIGKGTYGSVDEGIAMLADKVRNLGADAVINYAGSQRFGFFPWRFVRPVVRGTAIKWNSGTEFDCVASGGTLH